MKRNLIVGSLLLSLCFVSLPFYGHAAGEKAYPTKPVALVVAYNPGGGADLAARLLSGYFLKKSGTQLNVINKPGGGGVIATREVLEGMADGYTLLLDSSATSSGLAAFHTEKLPFDWRRRAWCATITRDVVVYAVRQDAPWKTLKEVAEFIKKNPKKVRWGTTGVSGIGAPAGMQFFRANDISLDMVTQVMFSGEGPLLTALAGGHVDFAGQNFAAMAGLIEGKKIRPLAISAAKRQPQVPDLPTASEAGYPTFDVYNWHGISGPAGLSRDIVEFWAKSMEAASKDPEFIRMAENVKKEVAYIGLKDFEVFVEKEHQKYVKFAEDLGIK